MKKIVCSILTAVALISSITAFADTPSVYYNGEKLNFDVDPYITDGRTMVPFRAIFEKADATVMWDGDSQTVIAVKDNGEEESTSIVLQIGTPAAFVNDRMITLDKSAEIVEGRTFVPLRFVMESLGANVEWDNDAYSVIITE